MRKMLLQCIARKALIGWAQSDLNDKRANSVAVSEADLLSV